MIFFFQYKRKSQYCSPLMCFSHNTIRINSDNNDDVYIEIII
jgi:hypothetical protein